MALTKGGILALITVILSVVILFFIVGNLSGTMVDGANSITDANNCSEFTDSDGVGTWTYNITDKRCYNGSLDGSTLAYQYDLPLSGLFSASGVIMIIVMVFILIGVVGLAMKLKGKQ